MPKNILVIGTDSPALVGTSAQFDHAGLFPTYANDFHDARRLLSAVRFDLIVSGIESSSHADPFFAEILLKHVLTHKTPVLVVGAARSSVLELETDKISGLLHFFPKPPTCSDLIRWSKNVLRWQQCPRVTDPAITLAGLTLDPATRSAYSDRGGRRATLRASEKEFQILYFLMSNPDRVFSRSDLVEGAWEGSILREQKAVNKCIERLRNKLRPGFFDGMIESIHGIGYKFSAGMPESVRFG
jgi:two-component system, OmpR family, phosphate regulon response regulator PhoB